MYAIVKKHDLNITRRLCNLKRYNKKSRDVVFLENESEKVIHVEQMAAEPHKYSVFTDTDTFFVDITIPSCDCVFSVKGAFCAHMYSLYKRGALTTLPHFAPPISSTCQVDELYSRIVPQEFPQASTSNASGVETGHFTERSYGGRTISRPRPKRKEIMQQTRSAQHVPHLP